VRRELEISWTCVYRKPHPIRLSSLDYAGSLWFTPEKVSFQYLSLRHHPVANGSQSRFCREKTRGICSILRPTSAPCNAASSQNRSLERPFLWSSVLSLGDTVSRRPLKQVFFEASADVEFEINSLDRGGLRSLRSRIAKIFLNAKLRMVLRVSR